jgi:hypothetical protein
MPLKRLPIAKQMIMANHPRSVEIVKSRIRRSAWWRDDMLTPGFVLFSIVSSPRLFEVYWKDVPPGRFLEAGDTYISNNTMLGDDLQKTYAISIAQWETLSHEYVEVPQYDFRDRSISKIQVWPFDPMDLSAEQMKLSVAVSFNDEEMQDEPRLCGALRDLMEDYELEFFWETRSYG